jgi:hypothetical protein
VKEVSLFLPTRIKTSTKQLNACAKYMHVNGRNEVQTQLSDFKVHVLNLSENPSFLERCSAEEIFLGSTDIRHLTLLFP